jgi:hypothetical protein
VDVAAEAGAVLLPCTFVRSHYSATGVRVGTHLCPPQLILGAHQAHLTPTAGLLGGHDPNQSSAAGTGAVGVSAKVGTGIPGLGVTALGCVGERYIGQSDRCLGNIGHGVRCSEAARCVPLRETCVLRRTRILFSTSPPTLGLQVLRLRTRC